MINREKAIEAFKAYTSAYDTDNVNIRLKIDHTYRVASVAERIAKSGEIGLDDNDVDFCWFLGLLHDIGRFEQVKRFNTFVDKDSVDHAEFGADILFKDGLIDSFIETDIDGRDDMLSMAETAIRLHNKLELPGDLDRRTRLFAVILRDADKCDIFRVLTEPPYDERNARVEAFSRSADACGANPEVMRCVREHRCVPRALKRNEFENVISSCCMAFELNFGISRSIVREQGYLDKLLELELSDEVMRSQMEELSTEIKKYLP